MTDWDTPLTLPYTVEKLPGGYLYQYNAASMDIMLDTSEETFVVEIYKAFPTKHDAH